MKSTYLILATDDNRVVAIDPSSGGYPYLTWDLRLAACFIERGKIDRYLEMFPVIDDMPVHVASLSLQVDHA